MPLSAAQLEAIGKAREILTEHFEASVLVVQYEVGDHKEAHNTSYHGGYALARGLIDIGRDYLRDSPPVRPAESDEDD